METLITNEWLKADGRKWDDRDVLVRFSDNTVGVARWNGLQWIGQDGKRVLETVGHFITHYYIFERYYG